MITNRTHIIGILETELLKDNNRERIYDLNKNPAIKTVSVFIGDGETTYSQNFEYPVLESKSAAKTLKDMALRAKRESSDFGEIDSTNYKNFLFT